MSEKKASSSATILIRLNGDETTATLIQVVFPTVRITRSIARRNPADAYRAYEGARIALARLYGQDPFPKQEEKPSKKRERFKVGDLARVNDHAYITFGDYATGDLVRVEEVRPGGYYIKVVQGPRAAKYRQNGFLRYVSECELEPAEDAQKDAAKGERFKVGDVARVSDRAYATSGCYAPGDRVCIEQIHTGGYDIAVIDGPRSGFHAYVSERELVGRNDVPKKPEKTEFKPGFQVGDIVQTGDRIPFTPVCRGCVAKVTSVEKDGFHPYQYCYALEVTSKGGRKYAQTCSEYESIPAPLTLLWREEEKA